MSFRKWFLTPFRKHSDRCREAAPKRAKFLEALEPRQLMVNQIVTENLLPGNPKSEWDVVAGGDSNIEGFSTDISVDQGQTVQFKINTDSTNYRLDIYRMGYYGGMGARKVATIQRQLSQPQEQPDPERDLTTGLVDAGNWGVSASWTVPANATSGIYFAKLVRQDAEAGSNHIIFVVRDDDGASDVLFQTSDTTWQAYNAWGGSSLYVGSPAGRAYKVSYNRPLETRTVAGGLGESNAVFWAEYPMVRWLEMNGYDVSYTTNVDTARLGAELLEHDAFLSVGHDEYWSAEMRANVEAARDAGLDLAFFSGNEVYWKVRWEESIDGNGTPYRTLVCYKESVIGSNQAEGLPPEIQVAYSDVQSEPDPSDIWTGLWRDMRFAAPGDAYPEQPLTGQMFSVNRGPGGMTGTSIKVPEADGKMRFWRNTSVAALGPGEVATLNNGTLGYEWDVDADTEYRPAGVVRLSSTTEFVPEKLVDPLTWPGCEGIQGSPCSLCRGCMVAPGTATHNMTMFRDRESGAIVFGAGTVQWSWGLDGNHDGVATVPDPRMQQATVNLFADMGIQPETLQANLTAATASTDLTAPISIITSPSGGLTVQSGSTPITITGTASDVGGRVGGIEISVDGGQSWRRAEGRASWSYSWIPSTPGAINIRTRATDDSINMETPGAGINFTVVADETTAPQISGVTALVVNNQTAVITWTTDETSDSKVIYGLTPNSLIESVYAPAMVTSHSVTLNNLTPNTNYYYRVVSVDEFVNEAISTVPPQGPYQVSTPAFTDTTVANFAAGTLGAGIASAQSGDGELILLPTVQAEFVGASVPSGWTVTPWSGGGNVTVNGGSASIDGARLNTDTFYGSGRALEFTATFSGAPFQSIGFGVDFNTAPWAMFSSVSGNGLYARTASGSNQVDTLIPGNWLGAAHRFRIEWTNASARYFIDDVEVASHAVVITASMRPVLSDFSVGGGALSVDLLRMSAYAAAGEYTSRVFDAGAPVAWTRLSWISDVPASTAVAANVRMGNTPTPDASWTDFLPLSQSGATIGGTSRYLQYRMDLGTTNTDRTPILHNVAISYATSGGDIYAPTVATRSPGAGAVNVTPTTSVVVKFSELMNAATINNSTVRLRAVGGSSDVPAGISFIGSTATLTPLTPLLPETAYNVTVSGSVADAAGNILGSNVSWSFTTGWLVFRDTTLTDFSTGQTGSGTAAAATGNGEITLAPQAGNEFEGTGIPVGWFGQQWGSGGSVTIGGGRMTVDGGMAGTSSFFAPGQTLEFVATLTGDAWQHVGFATDFSSTPWAIFSTGPGGSLRARTNNSHETLLPSVTLGVPHLFRIAWTASGVSYYVDGALLATHNAAIAASMRPVVSDYSVGGGAIAVDWLRMLPYSASGTFVSRVFDAGSQVAWKQAFWESATPAGTTLELSVRVGNTAVPDASWTDYVTLGQPGAMVGTAARYAQYRAAMTTSASNGFLQTPELSDFSIRYSGQVADVTPPAILSRSPAVSAADVPVETPVVVKLNDLVNAASVSAATFRLRAVGAGSDVSATRAVSGSTITLTPDAPLDPNRTYQVTVSGAVADLSGNALGTDATWNFTTTWLQLSDTSVANFGSGTLAGVIVGAAGDGELTLAAQLAEGFGGSALPSGWTSTPWGGGGATAVGGGAASVDGALLTSPSLLQPGAVVEFTANLSGAPYQHVGLGTDFSGTPWAIFSSREGSGLFARTSTLGDTPIPGSWFGAPHRYRIEWTASAMRFSIDGTEVAVHSTTMSAGMRALASDALVGGGAIAVDEVKVLPYVAAGSFVSRVFDAGQTVAWDAATWAGSTPSGTSMTVSVRMGQTLTPDAGWTEFVPLASSGAIVGGSSRYLQYRVAMTTTVGDVTPVLESFAIRYGTEGDTVAPTIVSRTPAPSATGVPLFDGVRVVMSELIDAASVTTSSVRLRVVGSPTDIAANVSLNGGTIFLTPAVALQGNTTYQMIVAGNVNDLAGNDLGADQSWTFTTGVGQWLQTAVADFAAGTHAGTQVGDLSGGEVQLAPAFVDSFSGSALGASWNVQSWESQGGGPTSINVSGGLLRMAGAQVLTAATFANQPLTARVRFGATPYQHFGLATDLSAVAGNYWAIFSTGGTTNTLFARVNASGATQDVNLGPLPAGYHEYRIVPTGSAFAFYVDGALATTISASFPGGTPLRIAMSSYLGASSGTLDLDMVQIESYAASGEFVSSVFDATRTANWGAATWAANVPTGTTLIVETRSGNTANPDGTWSGWAAASSGSAVSSQSGRYLQYRLRMTTSAAGETPMFSNVTFNWS